MRIAKRSELNKNQIALVRLGAVFGALVFGGLFLVVLGENPLRIYVSMVQGGLGSFFRFRETVNIAIPLLITSLGVMIAFKMRFWNIGAEGQIFMGGFAAAYLALNFSHLPKPVLLTLMAGAAMAMGGVWLIVPAWFKAKFGTNETLFTLMLNYIALRWVTYLQYSLWKDPSAMGFPKIASFEQSALLPKIFDIHVGWIVALILIYLIHMYLNHTKTGYEIAVIGESEDTARYAGIDIKRVILKTMFLSGAVSGLVGMIQASGISGTLSVDLTGGVGFTAIITAWLSGLNPIMVGVVSFLFAMLRQGGSFIQTAYQIPASAAEILQALILFFVLASEFFLRYKVVWVKKAGGDLK
ncbi:ABC transporter permease [Alkalibacter saccharofermentans]|uniref:Nucleoside ABC transporter membrane protein n=1 Tax=Alkalibacter saccharofermentans DSM 14828 TaxID=1120975 RepID=A0A1M4VUF6_9FIRM|nr:nucleoside ABC transporter membrane protein [Alkalibacter saccharofermentans DSM 14828]